jgi:hypothetical protein
VVAVLLVGVPGNIAELGVIPEGDTARYRAEQQFLLGAIDSPYARQVSRDANPYPGEGVHQISIGYLLDAAERGRLPDAPPLDDPTRAKIDTRLTLSQGAFDEHLEDEVCARQTGPVVIEPSAGDRFAFDGTVTVDHAPAGTDAWRGATGYSTVWTGRVLTAQVDGLRYRIRPAGQAPAFTWCTEP